MSVAASAWVWDNSPYTLGARLVHLAIADIVNPDNDWLLWASFPNIAARAKVSVPTVSSAVAKMVSEGYLELVERKSGAVSTYRFLRPTPKESEGSVPSKNRRGTPRKSKGGPPKSTESLLLPTQEKLEGTGIAPRRPTDDPLVRCAHDLTVLAFEQPVKPELRSGKGGTFPAVLGLIERLLRAGHSRQEIEAVILGGVEVWTIAGMQTALARSRPRGTRDPRRGRSERSIDEDLAEALGATR